MKRKESIEHVWYVYMPLGNKHMRREEKENLCYTTLIYRKCLLFFFSFCFVIKWLLLYRKFILQLFITIIITISSK